MARARAAADEVEEARIDLLGASAVIASAVIDRKTNPGMAVPRMPPPLPDPLPPWPETEPFNEAWSERSEVAPQVMSVLQKKLALERTPARGSAAVPPPPRSTVIPVPQLPAAADPRQVRPAVHSPSAQPRGRAARGTPTQQRLVDTVRTQAVQPKHDDKTSPYIELPPEVKPSGFAHTKRVAAKQR